MGQMIRRLTIVGVVSLLLFTSSLFADEIETPPTSEEVSASLTVIMDCISASLVTSCTDTDISLPCSNVSLDYKTQLPLRIAYFLADPAEYTDALAPADSGYGFFAALMSLLNSAVENPLVSAVYVALSARDYHTGGYLLSGSISFEYPEGVTLDDLLAIWSTRADTGQSIALNVDMQVFGANMKRPLSIAGRFDMSVAETGDIVVRSDGVYLINGFHYQNGEFRM